MPSNVILNLPNVFQGFIIFCVFGIKKSVKTGLQKTYRFIRKIIHFDFWNLILLCFVGNHCLKLPLHLCMVQETTHLVKVWAWIQILPIGEKIPMAKTMVQHLIIQMMKAEQDFLKIKNDLTSVLFGKTSRLIPTKTLWLIKTCIIELGHECLLLALEKTKTDRLFLIFAWNVEIRLDEIVHSRYISTRSTLNEWNFQLIS